MSDYSFNKHYVDPMRVNQIHMEIQQSSVQPDGRRKYLEVFVSGLNERIASCTLEGRHHCYPNYLYPEYSVDESTSRAGEYTLSFNACQVPCTPEMLAEAEMITEQIETNHGYQMRLYQAFDKGETRNNYESLRRKIEASGGYIRYERPYIKVALRCGPDSLRIYECTGFDIDYVGIQKSVAELYGCLP